MTRTARDVPAGLCDRAAVVEMTGLSTATIYRQIREGKFPQPADLPYRRAYWRKHEITAWIRNRVGR